MKLKTHILYSFLFLCFLLIIDSFAQQDTGKVYFGKAYKEYHYGIPFVYLEGSDYESGLQYGHLLKNEIAAMYREFENFKDNMLSREIKYLPWYQRIAANLFGGIVFRHKINTLADELSEDIKEQIRGASDGSGIPVSFFNAIQVFPDLFARHCEGIVIIKGGKTYHAHNLDQSYPVSIISKYPVVVSYNIKGKSKFTNIGFASCFSITTAFNENGISITENGNNNPKPFDNTNTGLYIEKNRFITQTHNLKEVDSLMQIITSPIGLLLTIASSREKLASVYDLLGQTKAATRVDKFQFIANKTMCPSLGKKSETIFSGDFHDTSRVVKFAELIDTTNPDIVSHLINILSNTDFYHYSDSIHTYIESFHNYETDQSVIFDLADSLVYFAIYPHFAAWSRWLKYNYITHEVSIYKEADPRLFTPEVSCLNKTLAEYESCDWRDSTNVRLLVNNIANSGISNYFTLGFLSKTYLEYYKLPGTALVYAGKLIEKYPDIPAGYFLKGQAFELIQNYEQAVINYLKAAECKINCEYYLALSYEHLAYSYSALKKDKEAVTYAVKALNIHNQYWIPDWYMDNIKKLEIIAGNEPGKKL